MTSLGNSLRQTLKKLACNTPVEQLVKRGVKEVNVLGLDHIVALIEEAVHRSLRHKLLGIDRAQVAGATREEFLRLLRSHQDLERSRDEALESKQRAEQEIDELRRQIGEQDKILRDKLARAAEDLRARHEGENSEILAKVNEIFLELAAHPDTEIADLRNHVLELVMDIVGKERQLTIQAHQAVHDREVDLLQRRIDKLRGNLEASELRFAGQATVDPGISSIYREVQGLNVRDRNYERRRELMTSIFQANLTLRKRVTLRGA